MQQKFSDLKKGEPVKGVEAQAQTEEEEIIIQANKLKKKAGLDA